MVGIAHFKELKDVHTESVRRAILRMREHGLLGKKNSDGTFEYIPSYAPSKVYVRVWRGTGLTLVTAYNTAVSLRGDMPVLLERTANNELQIIGVDVERAAAWAGSQTSTLGAPPHAHRIGLGNDDLVEQLRFEPGAVFPNGYITGAYDLYARIYPFWYWYNGVYTYYAGGTLDLTSYRPSTPGHWWWVKVGVDPVTNTATATADTTSQSRLTALTIAQLNAIDLEGAIPLAGVKLRTAQTVTEYLSSDTDLSDYVSCRDFTPTRFDHDLFNYLVQTDAGLAVVTDDGEPIWANPS